MSSKKEKITAAEAILRSLSLQGVEYLFANYGTDHTPLIEAAAKIRRGDGKMPEVVVCPHEFVALSTAHGYTAATGKPQAVLVHVDVGTQNLGAAMHNAHRSNIPVIIISGLAPVTDVGHVGSRDHVVHYLQDTFQQYYQLLGFIEDEKFESVILHDLQTSIASEKRKASEILKEFSKGIDALDQRNNFLFGFLANGFMLWDLKQSSRLEKWILQHRTEVSNWFKAVENFDAYNSLGNFAFNHQQYTFPKISEVPKGIEAKDLGHPLLRQTKRVDNDFSIESDQFFIITGANMAGKSTFLRTVALQIVMSNMGLPVCANSCTYAPIKLISSMRTSDSLGDDESYFFSELKRLKYIVDKIQTEKYFIILDEILKGTNSTDKAIGSKKFIERLVKSNSTGIIATHDLSLCETANQFEQVKNYYFDAEIENNELHFDYRFKKGICQNMNASFLLQKMGIV